MGSQISREGADVPRQFSSTIGIYPNTSFPPSTSAVPSDSTRSIQHNSAANLQAVLAPPPSRPDEPISAVFTWNHGGHNVFLVGSFNQWKTRIPMVRSGNEFSLVQELPKGVHHYKFIVDDEWRFAPDQPTVQDNHGNTNNAVDLTTFRIDTYDPYEDAQASMIYNQIIPDVTEYSTDPPPLPPHLQQVILNHTNNTESHNLLSSPLPTPVHVSLNHLSQCSTGMPSVKSCSSTQRYQQKFVTTVYYRRSDT